MLDEEKGSFRIKGTAERFVDGPMYDEVKKWVSDKLPREAAIVLYVEQLFNGAKQLL